MNLTHFGQFLLIQKAITPEQLVNALHTQKQQNFTFGEIALKTGVIDSRQYEEILQNQLSKNITFIDSAIALQHITEDQKEELFSKGVSNNQLLGEILVSKEVLTQAELDDYYHQYRISQTKTEFEILNCIAQTPYNEIIDIIIQSTINLFQYLLNVHPRISGFYYDSEKPDQYDWMVMQKITGDQNVIVQLFLKDDLLCPICSSLLRMEVNELNALSLDSAKEFLNVLTGFICSSLSLKDTVCDIEVPEIVNIEDLKQLPPEYRLPFFFSYGIFEIRLLFNDPE